MPRQCHRHESSHRGGKGARESSGLRALKTAETGGGLMRWCICIVCFGNEISPTGWSAPGLPKVDSIALKHALTSLSAARATQPKGGREDRRRG